jgi:hypothetical protein
MKPKILFSVIVLFILGGVYYYNTSDDFNNKLPPVAPITALDIHSTVNSAVTSKGAVEAPATPTPSIPAAKIAEPLKKKIGNYKVGKGAEYRAELEKNPHQTPDVAIISALELGEIFDDVKNETDAGQAFQFFAKCVATETVVSLQTSCLRYAKRLSENYPSVRALWPNLEASASDEVKDVLKFDQR